MKLLSELYDVTLKRGIEGAAKGGFVRPTIGENFMTHRDFKQIEKSLEYNEWDREKSGGGVMSMSGNYVRFKSTSTATSLHGRSWGKFYFEVRVNITYPRGPVAVGIGKWPEYNPSTTPNQSGTVTYDSNGSLKVNGGSVVGGQGSWRSIGWHTIGVAVNLDNHTAIFSRSGTSFPEVDFSSLGTGTYHTIVGVWHSTYDDKHFYGNWGESDFIYPIPEGYKPFLDLA